MWDWTHFKGEGWLTHTKRSAQLGCLLLLAGTAMLLHMVVPFWQQPNFLRTASVARVLCGDVEKRRE
tara:strand:+ start:1953 stop:2153 length:201 start_codon:yes stop_codon:yes gene_type:complete